MTQLASYLGMGLSLVCVGASFVLLQRIQHSERAAVRVQSLRRLGTPLRDEEEESAPLFRQLLGKVGHLILASGLLSRSTIQDLEDTIAAGGSSGGHKLAFFVGIKAVLLVASPLSAWMLVEIVGLHSIPLPVLMVFFAVVGVLAPDWIIRRHRKKYIAAVDLGMPAALDLLIMCSEAGLSLEAGLERVALEGQPAAPETANEFRLTANEMKILSDRRQALVNMGSRTKLDSAIRLGGTLAQSLKYGTPLIQALRVLAAEMRQVELTKFEERAARIPVLLTIPMIVFILPCIFVVVAGPAALQVIHHFYHK